MKKRLFACVLASLMAAVGVALADNEITRVDIIHHPGQGFTTTTSTDEDGIEKFVITNGFLAVFERDTADGVPREISYGLSSTYPPNPIAHIAVPDQPGPGGLCCFMTCWSGTMNWNVEVA